MLVPKTTAGAPDGPPRGRRITVLVAARRATTRSALWRLLEGEPPLEPIASASEVSALVPMLRTLGPDVVVLERGMLRDGVTELPELAAAAPRAAFILVGMGDHPSRAASARAAGAVDYVRLDEATERLASVALDATSGR